MSTDSVLAFFVGGHQKKISTLTSADALAMEFGVGFDKMQRSICVLRRAMPTAKFNIYCTRLSPATLKHTKSG